MSSGNHTAFIALGSNVGDRFENIRNAVALLAGNKSIELTAVSSVYETLPFGNHNQQNFYNAVVKIQTSSTVYYLFELLKKIELKLGRLNRSHWGPREIDLDILLFDNLILSDDVLTLPHKGMHLRDFVLLPLIEIDNSVVHPVLRIPLNELLNLVKERTIISKLEEKIIK
ncbi:MULTISPECIES: 2-amino-4-hydroxy-6-hydroxymethyldihydropteridine diphosphokinase [Ignavibacterium]|jgi:2-amino-4-hydroxy-6-hydroxymethyldihydropteridine diphosphokinase|uniref:2-amino-4-hydroxy-6- hydroxymethyldihydropteridine diphosphokinase n=1 Tax=Ignavibacterium TaxID=795750 RepID=UPI0025BE559A|nr:MULTISPECIES: 2-amino-4-hydroxy-6-hydroxymethyldihydropteridine diphosphokinase [Ignavibacterium]MBI5661214.1 2-amino-4-hydroxy-6-hydroxymethyldihydropteridine diphosphokinase [Ignavibacterium album]